MQEPLFALCACTRVCMRACVCCEIHHLIWWWLLPSHQKACVDRYFWPRNELTPLCFSGCVLPLTDAEQQLSEIREAVYKAKAKKVQLSWIPQLRAPCDQRVFTVHKGIKTFDLCQQHSLLVTGGLDRLVRMWNPIFPGWEEKNLMGFMKYAKCQKKKNASSLLPISLFRKPTGILKGHSAPIAYLSISSEDSQIFSVSTDGTAKVIHGSSLGWMDGWTDDGWAWRRPIFHFPNAFASHVALALNPLCIISCFRPIPGRSCPLSSCMLKQFSSL